MVLENLTFPFAAKVIGQVLQVVDSDPAERNEFGIDLIVEVNDQRHRIAARNVELLTPLPDGAEYLAAYLKRHQC